MAAISYQDALWLKRIADGETVAIAAADRDRLAAAGLIQVITPDDVAGVRWYHELKAEADRLSHELHHELHPGGLEIVTEELIPSRHRAHDREVRDLQDDIDRCKGETQEMWLSLSERDLLTVDLDLCAEDGSGGALAITDPGRDAARAFLWSEEFDQLHLDDGALTKRAERFIALRQALLAKGFSDDGRLDIAAAILSRYDGDIARFCALNDLAVAHQWYNYDRLPLLAALCRFEGDAAGIWRAYLSAYEKLQPTDLGAGNGSGLVALALITRRGSTLPAEASDRAFDRVMHIAQQMRLEGWPVTEVTNPFAATLAAARLPAAMIVPRTEALCEAFDRGGSTLGAFAGCAVTIAATWNLLRVAPPATEAMVAADTSGFEDMVARYDALIDRFAGYDSRRAVAPILLALLPGTPQRNLERFEAVSRATHEVPLPTNHQAIALALMDSTCPDWFDFTEFPWEFGCMLDMEHTVSAYGAMQRMGITPMIFGTTAPEAYGYRMNFNFQDLMHYVRQPREPRRLPTPPSEEQAEGAQE